jgi:uncharacterized membrane protein
MFGRSNRSQAVMDAAEELTSYGGDVVEDAKARRRLLAAVTAGLAARQRAKRQTGVSGLLRRLAEDRAFRANVVTMLVSLQQVWQRVERRRSHKVRNVLLVLGGAGAATAVVAVPSIRARVLGLVGGTKDRIGSVAAGASPTTITEEVEVDAPLSSVYNQWTQFEEFPEFMEGVETVEQLDDTRLRWVAKVAGKRAEWEAKILHQDPDRRIGWQSTDGKQTTGTVTFEPIGDERTRIRLEMAYTPEGPLERAGSAVGLDNRRVRGDLDRFKELIERRGAESGAWRGEIKAGRKTSSSEAV